MENGIPSFFVDFTTHFSAMVYTQVIRKCSTGAAPRDGTSHASGWEAVTNCVSSTVTDKEVGREVLFEDKGTNHRSVANYEGSAEKYLTRTASDWRP